MNQVYLHHRILATPCAWRSVAQAMLDQRSRVFEGNGGSVYGIWRAQIGRPRDELSVITLWPDRATGTTAMSRYLSAQKRIERHTTRSMMPTLRPTQDAAPTRQGNYAFRYSETPIGSWTEFLDLCSSAWPGFEASYDSQVIGLWQLENDDSDHIESLLLTRRPNLAMWERSKIPHTEQEAEVRRKLSRRYDLCTSTVVYTTTLLSATDEDDVVRWA